jgi:hypothetical protein
LESNALRALSVLCLIAHTIDGLSKFHILQVLCLKGSTMQDELVIEEMTVRAIQERMDEAFRAAMQRAIDIGESLVPRCGDIKPLPDLKCAA